MIGAKKKYGSVQAAMNTWRDYMVSMGFGYPLGVDLPGEKRGMIPNAAYYDKNYRGSWNGLTIISISIGQGEVTATPLQIANLGATIANRGYYITPHVVKEVEDEPLDTLYTTKHYTKVSREHYQTVVEGMRSAVLGGTCRSANIPGIERVMNANGFSYEVIFVNDGSTDRSWQVIEQLQAQAPDKVRGIKFRRNYGKSPALFCGFEQAQGDVVITMDADLQDSPDEIPELYRMITQEGYDLVSGWKQKRYDPLSKTLPTKLFNATARKVSGIKNLHDFNCGLKAYRKEVVKNIEVYGEMHRYIPYLAKNAGFKKIGEKVVHHQARKYGKTKFGLNRFVNGYLDLLSLWFLSRFGIKPMHFFGLLGSLMFIFGFIAVVIVGVSKLYYMHHGMPYRLVTDSPYFYLSLTSMIIGTQLFVAGFLGELISRNAPERNKYQIEKTI